MRKVVSLLLVVVFVLAFSSVALAASDTGLCNSPVFDGDPGHWTNENNDDVRFDTNTHRRAVPGNGGANSHEDSAATEHYQRSGETLVDPHDTL